MITNCFSFYNNKHQRSSHDVLVLGQEIDEFSGQLDSGSTFEIWSVGRTAFSITKLFQTHCLRWRRRVQRFWEVIPPGPHFLLPHCLPFRSFLCIIFDYSVYWLLPSLKMPWSVGMKFRWIFDAGFVLPLIGLMTNDYPLFSLYFNS